MKVSTLVLLILFPCMLMTVTRTVSLDGTQQYTSIQTAINASAPGDTVLVHPGRYFENIVIQTNNLTLISCEYLTNNPAYIDSTIIDGRQLAPSLRIYPNTLGILFRGFSVTNGKSNGSGGGILLFTNTTTTIKNCYITNNISTNGAGISINECTTYLSGLRINHNQASNMGGGIYIYGYMGTVNVTFDPVNRCSIYNNTAGGGQDIFAHSINNDLSIPLNMFSVINPTSFYACAHRSWGNDFHLLVDVQNAHHQEINSDLYVSSEGNDANDGLSPQTALKTINTAVYRIASDSLSQKTVRVLPGIYSKTTNQQIFPIALKSWVKVKGEGIDETQIIGEPDPVLTGFPLMVFSTYYQNHISLEDMSITSENSNNSCALYGYREDHVFLKNLRMHDLSPDDFAVLNIRFATNSLWDSVIVENILTNSMGFLRIDGCLTGIIRNCVFRNAESTFISPDVWAYPLIWVEVGQELRIENSIFSNITMQDDDSQAITFGGVANPSFEQFYTVRNCLFSNIICNDRAMLLHGNNNPIMNITNCTFAGQSGNGHALMVNGNVTVSNCIFYNDRPKEIAINPMDNTGVLTTLTLDYNLIKNGNNGILQAPGNTINYMDTNINANPLFVGGDISYPIYFSLSETSPCINIGTPDTTGLNLLPYDLAGNWRVWNGRIDMGCFEYGSEPWVSNENPEYPPLPDKIMLSTHPNPVYLNGSKGAYTFIEFTLPEKAKEPPLVDIYNIKGQKVRSIRLVQSYNDLVHKAGLSKEVKTQGFFYSTVFDCKDERGQKLASGIYIVKVKSDRRLASLKITLMN
jgi:hypothetical protein